MISQSLVTVAAVRQRLQSWSKVSGNPGGHGLENLKCQNARRGLDGSQIMRSDEEAVQDLTLNKSVSEKLTGSREPFKIVFLGRAGGPDSLWQLPEQLRLPGVYKLSVTSSSLPRALPGSSRCFHTPVCWFQFPKLFWRWRTAGAPPPRTSRHHKDQDQRLLPFLILL